MRNEWIYATPAQVAYLRRLILDADRRGIHTPWIASKVEGSLKSEASAEISRLKQLLQESR